jgi:hypothetical protein
MFVAVWLHTGGWIYLGLSGRHALSEPWMAWVSLISTNALSDGKLRTALLEMLVQGMVGTLAYTVLLLQSVRWVRNLFYETFLVAHIILAM